MRVKKVRAGVASKERSGSTALPRCGAYGLGFRVSPPPQAKGLRRRLPKVEVAFWDPHNKDFNFLESIFGSPYFRETTK